MRSIGVVPWSLTSSPMETLRMEFFYFLMQNAECKMQNEGSLRSEFIRFYSDKEIKFYPPDLKLNLKVCFYYQHSHSFIKPNLRRHSLTSIYTVGCDHNSAFCILHSAFILTRPSHKIKPRRNPDGTYNKINQRHT